MAEIRSQIAEVKPLIPAILLTVGAFISAL